jgi:hypothetical protein
MASAIEVVEDWLGISKYHMYRKVGYGDLEPIGTEAISWRSVLELKKLFPDTVYIRVR